MHACIAMTGIDNMGTGICSENTESYEVQAKMYADKLSVYAYNSTSKSYVAVVEGFALTAWNCSSVRAFNDVNTVTAGYVTVSIDTGVGDISGILNDIVH